MFKYFATLLIAFTYSVSAINNSSWSYVGNKSGITKDISSFANIDIDSYDTPYILYSHHGKSTIARFINNSWQEIGSFIPKGNDAFKISESNTIYYTFINHGKFHIMKFENNKWSEITGPQIDLPKDACPIIEILTGKNQELYIVYALRDLNSSELTHTLIKYNGKKWNHLGDPKGFRTVSTFPAVTINKNSGEIYIAYMTLKKEGEKEYYGSAVKKFNGITWDTIGGEEDFVINSRSFSITTDNSGQPYVSFITNSGLNVMKYSDNKWSYVGERNFAKQEVGGWSSLKIDGNNVPYIAYVDGIFFPEVSVMYFSNNKWSYLGKKGFAYSKPGLALELTIDSTNIPYIGTNSNDTEKVIVLKYN